MGCQTQKRNWGRDGISIHLSQSSFCKENEEGKRGGRQIRATGQIYQASGLRENHGRLSGAQGSNLDTQELLNAHSQIYTQCHRGGSTEPLKKKQSAFYQVCRAILRSDHQKNQESHQQSYPCPEAGVLLVAPATSHCLYADGRTLQTPSLPRMLLTLLGAAHSPWTSSFLSLQGLTLIPPLPRCLAKTYPVIHKPILYRLYLLHSSTCVSRWK